MTSHVKNYLEARWDAKTEARFWSKVDKTDDGGCWTWTGTCDSKGYGWFSVDNKNYSAHRMALVRSANDPFTGLVSDHLCRNRRCVNPAHLEAVSQQENVKRGDAPRLNGIRGALITHCVNGHPYTPENTRMNGFGRGCKECQRTVSRNWWRRNRGSRSLKDHPHGQ